MYQDLEYIFLTLYQLHLDVGSDHRDLLIGLGVIGEIRGLFDELEDV